MKQLANLTVPQRLALPEAGVVHLWQQRCSALQTVQPLWQTWLAPDECDRLARLNVGADRDRFIGSRGGLRYLLASYLGQAPTAVHLRYGNYGRPHLLNVQADLYFNVAHSGDWLIWGFSRCAQIGVDVEIMRPRRRLRSLVQRCLSHTEQAHLATEPAAQLRGFLQYWTVKEAHLKAVGVGLSYPVQQVEVALQPAPAITQPAALPGQLRGIWQVQLWQPDATAIAAVCVGQQLGAFELFTLTAATKPEPLSPNNSAPSAAIVRKGN